jgi:hypothetical protein
MMRYYFKLTDGEVYNDHEGADLPDVHAAEDEATRIATEWLRDNPDTFLQEGALRVQILDAHSELVATIRVAIERADNVVPLRNGGAR